VCLYITTNDVSFLVLAEIYIHIEKKVIETTSTSCANSADIGGKVMLYNTMPIICFSLLLDHACD